MNIIGYTLIGLAVLVLVSTFNLMGVGLLLVLAWFFGKETKEESLYEEEGEEPEVYYEEENEDE